MVQEHDHCLNEMAEVKKIADSRVQFTTEFNDANTDLIYLVTDVNDVLLDMLKTVCLAETTTYQDGNYQTRTRYKVKGWLYNSLGFGREVLFDKELIDTGSVKIGLSQITQIEQLTTQLKTQFAIAVRVMNNVVNLKQVVTYTQEETG